MTKRTDNFVRPVAALIGSSMLCLSLSGCHHDPNKEKQKYLASGKHYESEGRLREAVIQFSNALRVDKNFAPAHYELGKTYLQLGSVIAGYQELQRTVNLNPGNLQARLDLGNILLAGGVPARAKEQAEAILAAQPSNAEAYGLLSRIALKQGDKAEALTEIQKAISLNPTESKFHTSLGLIESLNPETKAQGEEELRKAVSLDNKSPGAHLALAGMLANQGNLQGAEQQAQAAIDASPQDLQPRLALAELYAHAGDRAKAEQALIDAVDAMPDKEQAPDVLLNYYFRTGQADRAQSVFADLRSKHAKSIPIQIAYARVLVGRGKWDEAGEALKNLSKSNGSNPEVARLNAELLLHQGKLQEAFTGLQKAANNAPDDVKTQLLLAQTAAALGKTDVAEAALKQASRLDPQNLDAARGMAQLAIGRKDFNQLSQLADKVIAAHPNAPDGYIWRGSVEGAQQDLTKAEADFREALKRDPNSAAAQLDLGELQLHQNHDAEGRALLESALAHNPNLVPALNMLVMADLKAKQPEKAMSRIQEQIGKVPNNPALYEDLAQLQMQNHDFAGAQGSAQHALQLNKNFVEALETSSQAQVAQGNTDGALAAWQGWLAAHPADARAETLIGSLYQTKGDSAQAMEAYKKALQLDPSQAVAANNLAYLMVESNDNLDVALSYAQTARQAMPQSPSTADTLAWVYYHKGTYSLAKDLLTDAVKQDPNDASMHYHLGMTLSKLGDKAGATAEFKKVETLAPNTTNARDAENALHQLG